MAGEGGAQRLGVVVGDDDGVRGDRGGDARRGRDAERGQTGTGPDEERVGVPVVAAREGEHAAAPGERAREPERRHRRLGSRADQPDHLHGGDGVDDLRGELDLALRRGAEARTLGRRPADRLDRLGIGVPEDERPPGADPVEQPFPSRGLDVGALAPGDEERLLHPDRTHRTHRRVDTTGDQTLRARPER